MKKIFTLMMLLSLTLVAADQEKKQDDIDHVAVAALLLRDGHIARANDELNQVNLEDEMRQNAWLSVPSDRGIIFDAPLVDVAQIEVFRGFTPVSFGDPVDEWRIKEAWKVFLQELQRLREGVHGIALAARRLAAARAVPARICRRQWI